MNQLNEDQHARVVYLNGIPRESRCACGWELMEQCPETNGRDCFRADNARYLARLAQDDTQERPSTPTFGEEKYNELARLHPRKP